MIAVGKLLAEIVLTGSGGKTSALSYLSQRLGERGIRVLTADETATRFIRGGLQDLPALARQNPVAYRVVEREMLGAQVESRQRLRRIAEAVPEPTITILDRGEMDFAAYLEEEEYWSICDELGLDIHDVRDGYSAVIHLHSAAVGAEDFYTTANNSARSESVEQARDLDARTLHVWMGHPHLRVVTNENDFETKLRRVEQLVCHAAGIPAPTEIERKFLLREFPGEELLRAKGARRIDVTQAYMVSKRGKTVRIRRWADGARASYFLTEKSGSGLERMESERPISRHEYELMLQARDPELGVIEKQRWCLIENGQLLEIDLFPQFDNLCVAEVELVHVDEEVRIPSWLPVERDVTLEKGYSNKSLAKQLGRVELAVGL